MKKQDIKGKSISELRTMAKKSGISAGRQWKKEDFIKALSKETGKPSLKNKPVAAATKGAQRSIAKKAAKKKPVVTVPAKKTAARKTPPKAAAGKASVGKSKKPAKVPVRKAATEKMKSALEMEDKKRPRRKTGISTGSKPAKKGSGSPKMQKKVAGVKNAETPIAVKTPTAGKIPRVNAALTKMRITSQKETGGRMPQGYLRVSAGRRSSLPEYVANNVTAMPVSPEKIYVFWEITPEKIAKYKGSLNLRISKVKRKRFPYIYLPLSRLTGEQFVRVGPDTRYIAEIGVVNRNGKFVGAVQSNPVATPPATARGVNGRSDMAARHTQPPEDRLPEEFYEVSGHPSSY